MQVVKFIEIIKKILNFLFMTVFYGCVCKLFFRFTVNFFCNYIYEELNVFWKKVLYQTEGQFGKQ